MLCPYCGSEEIKVLDSRPTEGNHAIKRRRQCESCGGRFTTMERVQLRDLYVIKRSGKRVPFDRDKILRSVLTAVRKRPVSEEQTEQMVNGIIRRLESEGESDIRAEMIGELVMEGLSVLDDVAYIRFASVYKNFREAEDFGSIVEELKEPPTKSSTK